jgi:15-cis-phytoene desaturase
MSTLVTTGQKVGTNGNSVLIMGGGLAGLVAAKRLVDKGFKVHVIEKREIFGGKVSSWKDEEGDWIESGTHCFFGAYDVLYDLMQEIGTYDAVLWKKHELTYTLSKGERFTFGTWNTFSPFHLTPSIIKNRYFTIGEMVAFVKALIPLALKRDKYPPTQDHLTFAAWAKKMGIGDRFLQKMYRPMALALKFIPPEEITAKIILDVTEVFYRIPEASRMGFLKGAPQEYLIGPLVDYVRSKGATVENKKTVKRLLYDGDKITAVELTTGELLTADSYIAALPIHNLNRVLPEALGRKYPFFNVLKDFQGVPVISVQIWYDKQITEIDNVLFSPDGIIPVYADLGNTTPDYRTLRGKSHKEKSRIEFCVGPAKDLMKLKDEEIVARVDANIRDCFPETSKGAKILKSTVVRIPQSVYAPLPNCDAKRPSQKTPVPNLFLAGGFTQQPYYDSMGGAVFSANRATEEIFKKHGIPV